MNECLGPQLVMVIWVEIFHTLSTPVARQMCPAGWVNISF
jgi:hypothetical protein